MRKQKYLSELCCWNNARRQGHQLCANGHATPSMMNKTLCKGQVCVGKTTKMKTLATNSPSQILLKWSTTDGQALATIVKNDRLLHNQCGDASEDVQVLALHSSLKEKGCWNPIAGAALMTSKSTFLGRWTNSVDGDSNGSCKKTTGQVEQASPTRGISIWRSIFGRFIGRIRQNCANYLKLKMMLIMIYNLRLIREVRIWQP